MPNHKYLVLFRSAAAPASPSAAPGGQAPSPEQMQQMFAAYKAWMEKFKDSIPDMGDKLKPGGRVVTGAGVADGPFVELKEIVGGYMIVAGDSFEDAVAVVADSPGAGMPGASFEIRELAGARM